MAFSDLFSRRRKDEPDHDTGAAKAPVHSTKVLAKFIASLNGRTSPVLLDLGSVHGANVTFFGERLGCKIIVEDLSKDIDRAVKDKTITELPAHFKKRFAQEDGSVDGVLCWDIFDFLEPAAARALAHQVVRVLRPGGAVMGFFCTKGVERASFTKFEIIEETSSLRHRHHAGTGGAKFVLQNRDIIKMFEGLAVAESFLLKSNTREMLLRRRA